MITEFQLKQLNQVSNMIVSNIQVDDLKQQHDENDPGQNIVKAAVVETKTEKKSRRRSFLPQPGQLFASSNSIHDVTKFPISQRNTKSGKGMKRRLSHLPVPQFPGSQIQNRFHDNSTCDENSSFPSNAIPEEPRTPICHKSICDDLNDIDSFLDATKTPGDPLARRYNLRSCYQTDQENHQPLLRTPRELRTYVNNAVPMSPKVSAIPFSTPRRI